MQLKCIQSKTYENPNISIEFVQHYAIISLAVPKSSKTPYSQAPQVAYSFCILAAVLFTSTTQNHEC